MNQVASCFHRRHEALFTYALEDQEVVLVNARVAVTGELPATPREAELPDRPAAEPKGQRPVHIGDWQVVEVFDLAALAPGQAIQGPAVVESETTTVLLRPGDRAVATPLGWLDIEVPGLEMENGT